MSSDNSIACRWRPSVPRTRIGRLPRFPDTIERYLAQGGGNSTQNAIFFMFHLLGQWREKAAYRPLARLLRRPPDEVDAMFGGCSRRNHISGHGRGFRWRPRTALRRDTGPAGERIRPLRTVRNDRDGRGARRDCRARMPAASCAHAIPPSIRRAKVGCGTVGKAPLRSLALRSSGRLSRGPLHAASSAPGGFGSSTSKRTSNAGSPIQPGCPIAPMGTSVCSATPSRSSQAGLVSLGRRRRARNALPARTHRHCGGACRQQTRCGMWAAMIPVRAAAAGNSRNAASQPTPVQQPCLPADAAGAHSCTPRKRSAFPITLTEESAIAAAAMTGESRMPNSG